MIIGISGKIGSGKDTAAALLFRIFIKEKYSKISKEMSEYLCPTNKEILDDPTKITSTKLINWKRAFFADIPKEFICEKLLKKPKNYLEDREIKDKYFDSFGKTGREIMVGVGDGLRETVSEEIWVNAFWSHYNNENIIITDLRYPNEANSIIERGGLIIRISSEFQKELNYKSEISLDNYNFKYKLKNGNLDQLESDLYKILKQNQVL